MLPVDVLHKGRWMWKWETINADSNQLNAHLRKSQIAYVNAIKSDSIDTDCARSQNE